MELGVLDAVNSAVVCVIGIRTAQFGFVPANLLCIGPSFPLAHQPTQRLLPIRGRPQFPFLAGAPLAQ
jgi:hypothetical protein